MPSANAVQQTRGESAAGEPWRSRSSRATTVGAIVLLAVFQLPIVGWLVPGNSFKALIGGECVYWAIAAILVAYVLFIERRQLSSIGLKRPAWKNAGLGFAGAAVMIGGAVLLYAVVFPALGLQLNQAAAGLSALQSMPRWFQLLLAARAAVFEEIFYRGFAIERISEITGLRWLAALISLAAFTYAHLSYWGWIQLIVVAFQGAVLTGLYLFRRDLSTTMIAHFVTDVASFLLL